MEGYASSRPAAEIPELSIADLMHATPGNAAVDLGMDKHLTLSMLENNYWSLWFFAFRDRRNGFQKSILTSQGFIVHPGIIT